MIPSPCIGFCRLDESSGLCIGCGRTGDEIAIWSKATVAVREEIWAELPERRAKLGIGLHPMGWTRENICSFIAETLRARNGTWVFGVYGAVAEFCMGPTEAVDLDCNETKMIAATSRGAVRFEIPTQVQMLTMTTTVEGTNREVIVLAVPRPNTRPPRHNGLTNLGVDRDAVLASGHDQQLYDFGLGMDATEFCIRTDDASLIEELNNHLGKSWSDLLAHTGELLLRSSPTRVVRSAVGRVEVFTSIPLPGGKSEAGPHTHFLPAQLSTRRETAPGLELPESLAPCAIFYPEMQS